MAKKDDVVAPELVIARIAAARASIRAAGEFLDDALELYLTPSEDPRGRAREEALEGALDACGDASRFIELSQGLKIDLDEAPEFMPQLDDEDEAAE